MAPPPVSTQAPSPLLVEATQWLRRADDAESRLYALPQGPERRAALEEAEHFHRLAAPLFETLGHMDGFFQAQDLAARLRVHRDDCQMALGLFASTPPRHRATHSSILEAECLLQNDSNASATHVAGYAIDRQTRLSPQLAARAWLVYGNAVARLMSPDPLDEEGEAGSQREWPEAVMAFEAAVEHAPQFVSGLLTLGFSYYRDHQLLAAEAVLERVFALPIPARELQTAWQLRWILAYAMGRKDDALAHINTAIAQHPDELRFHIERMEFHHLRRAHADTLVAYRDSLQRIPPPLRGSFQIYAQEEIFQTPPYNTIKPPQDLLPVLQRAIAKSPRDALLLLTRARIERRLATTRREHEGALKTFGRVLKLRHTLPKTLHAQITLETMAQHTALALTLLNAPRNAGDAVRALRLLDDGLKDGTPLTTKYRDDPGSEFGAQVLAHAAAAHLAIGSIRHSSAHYEEASALWTLYSDHAGESGDPEGIHDNMATLMKRAEVGVLASQVKQLTTLIAPNATLQDTGGPIGRLQNYLIPKVERTIITLHDNESYQPAVELYRATMQHLGDSAALRPLRHRLQAVFQSHVIAGVPFELAYALNDLVPGNPTDPSLCVLLAMAFSYQSNQPENTDPAAVEKAHHFIERAWARPQEMSPSNIGIFTKLRLSYNMKLAEHLARSAKNTRRRVAILQNTATLAEAAIAASPQDIQLIAIATTCYAQLQQLTKKATHQERMRALVDLFVHRLPQITERRLVRLAAPSHPDDIPEPQPIPILRSDTLLSTTMVRALFEVLHAQQRYEDIVRVYEAEKLALQISSTDPESVAYYAQKLRDVRRTLFEVLAARQPFNREECTEEERAFAEMFYVQDETDPIGQYFYSRMTLRYHITKKTMWDTDSFMAFHETHGISKDTFEKHLSALPPTLTFPFLLERIIQQNYIARVYALQLDDNAAAREFLLAAQPDVDGILTLRPDSYEAKVNGAWTYYWLGKTSWKMPYFSRALELATAARPHLEQRARNGTYRDQLLLHETLRIVGWATMFRDAVPPLRSGTKNYEGAKTIIAQKLFPIARQLDAMHIVDVEPRQDMLTYLWAVEYFYAEAADHNRLPRLAALPLKSSFPSGEVTDADIRLANQHRHKALEILKRFGPEERPFEVKRALAATLVRMSISKVQEAQHLANEVIFNPSHKTKQDDNLAKARDVAIIALHLELRIPDLLPEEGLMNLLWIVHHAYTRYVDNKRTRENREPLEMFLGELRTELEAAPAVVMERIVKQRKDDTRLNHMISNLPLALREFRVPDALILKLAP